MGKNFVHLHNHTENSMLDGLGRIPAFVQRAKVLGMPALGKLDHGNLSGAYEFYRECLDNGIEPIIGFEGYFVPDAESVRDDKNAERFHIGILARNERGYETLVELSTESHHKFYYKPLLDRKMLRQIDKKDRKNLVVLSGCAASRISRMALGEIEGDVDDEILWWKKTFPNFYTELMHHNTDFDRKLNRRLLKLTHRHELPWVVTNDPHYVMEEECDHHDALLAIQTASNLDDENRFRFSGEGYHLRSRKEMARAFKQYGDEVWKPGAAATLHIAQNCRIRIRAWDSRSWHIPKFPDVADAYAELKQRAWDGLRSRGLDGRKRYVKRLKHELREFKKVGMADFLLITADLVEYATNNGIRVGPGRGSVCGTLVGYLIGIHKIDPIRYDLLFERFLNPERPKMPDIDTDYQRSRRSEMFQYAEDKYGADNIVRVGAFQRFQTKAAFKSLCLVYGIPFLAANELSKEIIEDEDGDAVLPETIQKNYPDLHATLMAIKGLKRTPARHPAGLIIFDKDDPVKRLVPQMRVGDDKTKTIEYVSQFDLDDAAAFGLMKQDFLGLRTLDTIDECVRLVRERHGVELDPDSWVPDEEEGDRKIWKMLRDGHSAGIFQMEGGANHRGIQEIKCSGFEDIVSCTSLYRAGPMIAGAPKRFLENKADNEVRVAHKSLKPYLERSWGELIYQEQMFQILNECAGFSWSRVDDAKTAMTKKDPEKMAALKDEAVEGFQKVAGMSERKAEEVWEMIAAQSSYLFNRSHAVAYSMITYQTARLKMMYPLEYLAALLRTVEGGSQSEKEKREAYMTEALRYGFKILPPDVNVSDAGFMPNGDNELLFGLVDIKKVGIKAVEKLTEKRSELGQFKSVEQVAAAVNNKGVVDALAVTGSMRSLGVGHDPTLQEELLHWQFEDFVAPFRKKYANKLKAPKRDKQKVCVMGEIVKCDKRTTKNGKDYYVWVLRQAPGEEYKVSVWDSAFDLFRLKKGAIVMVAGRWSAQWSNIGVDNSDQVKIITKKRPQAV